MNEIVLEKVRKLLAKAENCSAFGTAEGNNEAEALMAKAQQMIAEYAITEAMLSTRRLDNTKPEARVVKVHPPYAMEKTTLLGSVAKHNRTRVVITKLAQGKEPMDVTLVGFPDDLDATEMVFTSLLMQMVNEMMAHPFEVRTTAGGYVVPGGSKETQRRNFMHGYANRVGERLDEASRAAEETVQQTETSSVALVLLDRKAQVAAAYREMFPDSSRVKRTTIGDRKAYAAGFSAGSRADLGQQRIAPRRALTR